MWQVVSPMRMLDTKMPGIGFGTRSPAFSRASLASCRVTVTCVVWREERIPAPLFTPSTLEKSKCEVVVPPSHRSLDLKYFLHVSTAIMEFRVTFQYRFLAKEVETLEPKGSG